MNVCLAHEYLLLAPLPLASIIRATVEYTHTYKHRQTERVAHITTAPLPAYSSAQAWPCGSLCYKCMSVCMLGSRIPIVSATVTHRQTESHPLRLPRSPRIRPHRPGPAAAFAINVCLYAWLANTHCLRPSFARRHTDRVAHITTAPLPAYSSARRVPPCLGAPGLSGGIPLRIPYRMTLYGSSSAGLKIPWRRRLEQQLVSLQRVRVLVLVLVLVLVVVLPCQPAARPFAPVPTRHTAGGWERWTVDSSFLPACVRRIE